MEAKMCDYSLAVLPNRLAVEGEELIVYGFSTGSKGLAPSADLRAAERPLEPSLRKTFWQWLKSVFEDCECFPNVPAVCVPPGAHLLLKNIPADLQLQWRVEDEETILFVQISALENTYRDAVRFRHGLRVLLQDLRDGMLVQVLSLDGVEVSDEQGFAARLS
jgi:hypothetical protein